MAKNRITVGKNLIMVEIESDYGERIRLGWKNLIKANFFRANIMIRNKMNLVRIKEFDYDKRNRGSKWI